MYILFRSNQLQFIVKVFKKYNEAKKEKRIYDKITKGKKNKCKLIHLQHPEMSPFVVMESMDGDLSEKKLSLVQINTILTQVNDAMGCMQPYLYVDLKPENLLYRETKDNEIIWWFGDIGSISKESSSRFTCTYMALADKNESYSIDKITQVFEYSYLATEYLLQILKPHLFLKKNLRGKVLPNPIGNLFIMRYQFTYRTGNILNFI